MEKIRKEIETPRFKNIPIRVTAKEHSILLKIKERYANHLNMRKLTWDSFFIIISEEIKNQLDRLDNERRNRS